MKTVLLDTHAWAWSLTADERLSKGALNAIAAADTVLVSPISFFEITQKVRLNKWPDMPPFTGRLPALLEAQGGAIADLDGVICANAGTMDWTHRDPFDRLLAATAIHRNLRWFPPTLSLTAWSQESGEVAGAAYPALPGRNTTSLTTRRPSMRLSCTTTSITWRA